MFLFCFWFSILRICWKKMSTKHVNKNRKPYSIVLPLLIPTTIKKMILKTMVYQILNSNRTESSLKRGTRVPDRIGHFLSTFFDLTGKMNKFEIHKTTFRHYKSHISPNWRRGFLLWEITDFSKLKGGFFVIKYFLLWFS